MTKGSMDTQRRVFQAAIRQVRIAASLTQQSLAAALGVPQSYVSKYESGERRLDYTETLAVLEACDCTLAEFNELCTKLLNSQQPT